MVRFRFVAVDTSGNVKRGELNAASRDDAIKRIENHNLKVREVAVADDYEANTYPTAQTVASVSSHESAALPEEDLSPNSTSPNANSQLVGSTTRRIRLSPLFSTLALLIANAALYVTLFQNPLGRGITAYDFSSPEAAAKSLLQIEKNKDFKARMELEELKDGSVGDEMARTFEVHRTADYKDRKVLFISFNKKVRRSSMSKAS